MSTTTEDTTPSALSSAPPPGLTELNNLIDSLNNLITSYLNLFDIYQPLRENLSKKLSSGFFNISQANYASPGHKRYGEDYFDDRMKALRGVHIIHPATPTSPSSITPNNPAAQQSTEDLKLLHHPTFKLHDFLLPSNSNPAHEIKEEEEEGGLRRRKVHNTTTTTTTNDITTTNEKEEVYTNGYNNNNEKEKEDELIPPLSAAKRLDPLRWFGVLIPQSLRTAQRDFIDSLEDITTLSTLLSEMDRHEECIRELREQIKVKKKELEGRVVEYQWKTVAGGVGGG